MLAPFRFEAGSDPLLPGKLLVLRVIATVLQIFFNPLDFLEDSHSFYIAHELWSFFSITL